MEHLAPALGPVLDRHLRRADVIGVAGTTQLVGMNWAHSGIQHAHGIVTHPAGAQFEVSLYGVTAPLMQGMQALDGVLFAARREVAETIRFDEDTFDGWHGYDTDFSYRCHQAGLRVDPVAFDIPLVHYSSGGVDEGWLKYDARFRAKHGPAVVGPDGRWLEVTMRVQTVGDVVGAYKLQKLVELTETVERARKILSPARSRWSMKPVPVAPSPSMGAFVTWTRRKPHVARVRLSTFAGRSRFITSSGRPSSSTSVFNQRTR